jgi:hypothetical protein
MSLNRDQILFADDKLPTLTGLHIPEWGGSVSIRVMSGRQRERFEAAVNQGSHPNLRGLFATLIVCDAQGVPLFNDADIATLGEKSSTALDRIYRAGIKLNAIGKEGIDALEKNSEAATSGATPTDSPLDTTSPTSIDS